MHRNRVPATSSSSAFISVHQRFPACLFTNGVQCTPYRNVSRQDARGAKGRVPWVCLLGGLCVFARKPTFQKKKLSHTKPRRHEGKRAHRSGLLCGSVASCEDTLRFRASPEEKGPMHWSQVPVTSSSSAFIRVYQRSSAVPCPSSLPRE